MAHLGWSPTRQAVVLVGGKGTRLGNLAREIPKPLLPIEGDRRFLDYLLDQVARQGFDDILLVCGHLGEQVEGRYQDSRIGSARVRVVREKLPRGTAGALTEVASLLEPTFLMLNGDAFLDFNLRAFDREAQRRGTPHVLAMLRVDDARRYGAIEHADGQVLAFREKDPLRDGASWINAGAYHLHRDICSLITALPASIEVDIFPQLVRDKQLGCVPVEGWFLDIGLPETLAYAREALPQRARRPCAFFDRDGTLNVDEGYTHKPEKLVWRPGAREAIRLLNDRGWRVIVCTNQAGVAKGHFAEPAIAAFHSAMQRDLFDNGSFIDAFYYCPYHEEASEPAYRRAHEDRKPKPGMLLTALREWDIDVARSFMLGDQPSDVAAGQAAGLAVSQLVGDLPVDRVVQRLMAELEGPS